MSRLSPPLDLVKEGYRYPYQGRKDPLKSILSLPENPGKW